MISMDSCLQDDTISMDVGQLKERKLGQPVMHENLDAL
jgi:hypothetical protein